MIRATLLLAVSTVIILALERFVPIRSVRLRRFVWFAVLLQGVLLVGIPLTFTRLEHAPPASPSEPGPVAPTIAEFVPERPFDPDFAAIPVDAQVDYPPPGGNVGDSRQDLCGVPHVAARRSAAYHWQPAHITSYLPHIWLVGVVFFVVHWLFGYCRLLLSARNWRPAPDDWTTEWNALSGRRTIPLYVSQNVGPALVRLPLRFVLVVPQTAWERLTAEQRSRVMRHELAHFRRYDLCTSAAAWLMVLPHWFNPLAWTALRRFDALAELACDDFAHENTDRGVAEYCRALLLLQEWLPRRAGTCGPGLPVHGRKLSDRISRLVHFNALKQGDPMMKKTLLVIVAILLLAVGAFRVHVVAQQETLQPAVATQEPGTVSPALPVITIPEPDEEFMQIAHTMYQPSHPWADEKGNIYTRTRDTFTYDDKNFWEWKDISERELNPERHIEIVNALAAFGRKGFGKESTEAILKLMEDRPDFDLWNQSERQLFPGAVRKAFSNVIPLKYSLPTLLTAYTKAPEEDKSQPLALLVMLAERFPDLGQHHPEHIVPIFLELLQPKMQGRFKGIPPYMLSRACGQLADHSPEVQTALEKAAFSIGDVELRRIAINATFTMRHPNGQNRVVEKYLLKLIPLLLSESIDEQTLAGTTVFNLARNAPHIGRFAGGWTIPNRRSPLGSNISPFQWCEEGTSFYNDDRVFRWMILSLFAFDPTGESTATFLKGAAAKRNIPNDFAAIAKDISDIFAPLSRLFVDPETRKALPSVERLRSRLADSPEILKALDDLVESVGK